MFGEAEIQLVCEQRIELQADERALGDDGSVLLLDGEEMLVCLAVGEDDGLASEGSDLRATDIENITMTGQIGQGDVVAFGHQTIAEAGPVYIERNLVALAHLIDMIQLSGRVEGAQLRGEGDVDETRMDGMILVAVVHIVVEIFVERRSLHLAIGIRDGDDLMLRKLDGSCLMDIDVTRPHTDNSLVLIKHRVDGGGVGLGASGEEEYLRIGQSASLTDSGFGAFGELVEAIRRRFGVVIPYEMVENLLAGPVVIVAFKG